MKNLIQLKYLNKMKKIILIIINTIYRIILMLVSLEIKNFLLIKKISINFINGFNAFTGETGAGKSIIIEGLKLALGGKNQTNLNLKDNEDFIN